MTRSPPRLPPPLSDLFTLLDYLAASADWQNATLLSLSLTQPAVAAQLTALFKQGASIMATNAFTAADLEAKLAEIAAFESADTTALQTMGTALSTIVADLQALPPAGAITQAELDAAVQKATDVASVAAANAATIVAQSAQATAAVPAPTPTPAP